LIGNQRVAKIINYLWADLYRQFLLCFTQTFQTNKFPFYFLLLEQ
jgi:hypothetical protein